MQRRAGNGFTLIELLVVMAIIAALLSIAAPRYFGSVDKAKEVALQANLRLLRETIDKYKADSGELPATLQVLVDRRYLRAVPLDPMTDSVSTWQLVGHPDGVTAGIYDVRSGSEGTGRDGSTFGSW